MKVFMAKKMFNQASKTGFLLTKTKFFNLNSKFLYIRNVVRSLYSLVIILKLKKKIKPVILKNGIFSWIFVARITIERALI